MLRWFQGADEEILGCTTKTIIISEFSFPATPLLLEVSAFHLILNLEINYSQFV